MKKKIIAIFAIFILCFNIMSSARHEKTEASALLLSYAIFKAGVSFTAFTGFASLMAVNGYHMQLSDLAVAFADKYYDYANGVYTEKGSKINALEKLSLATASFLSGNDPLTLSELDVIKNSVIEDFPTKINISDLQYDTTININTSYNTTAWLTNNQGFYEFSQEYNEKYFKLTFMSNYPDYFAYIKLSNYDWYLHGAYHYPTAMLIMPNGRTQKIKINKYMRFTNLSTHYQTIKLETANTTGYTNSLIDEVYSIYRDNYIDNTNDLTLYNTTSNTFSDGTSDFIKAYPNYYSALSGKASTTEELIGLMNTDEYLQREVAKLLENQKVNEQNTLEVPTVVDGVITYPTVDIPDVPDVPYSPTETWYNNLLGWVSNIPDLLIGGITDLFNETLIPALDSLKDIVLQIPDLLTNIWNWILDFPDLLYSWFVPTAPMISETWEPLMDLWDLKLDPIIAPFKTLTFYETEYQDISVPLKFGSYEKEHKIIDFQYIKSQRDSIKSLIRAFLWILIIFFNLDQIHRLIRNQSLLNTYVRKIDKGA